MHTPGPYLILDLRKHGEECITIAAKATPEALCRIRNEVSGRPLDETDEANARLFAAAPEMLAEIVNVIDVLDPEMGRLAIVELRERLIQFRSKVTDAAQTSAMGEA